MQSKSSKRVKQPKSNYTAVVIGCLLVIIAILNFLYFSTLEVDPVTYLSNLHAGQILENVEILSHTDWQKWLAEGFATYSIPSDTEDHQEKDEHDPNIHSTITPDNVAITNGAVSPIDISTSNKNVNTNSNTIISNIHGKSNIKFQSLQKSNNAYVTLIAGLDNTYKYRGFLCNAIIMKHALKQFGSTADFIALIGLNNEEEDLITFRSDLELLESYGVIIYVLPRFVDLSVDRLKNKFVFAEMALLKITPWSFTHYKRIQFLDGDVMPTANMDCYFELNQNSYTVGAASPLNSGWYMAVPNMNDYEWMRTAVSIRKIWCLLCFVNNDISMIGVDVYS